MPDFASHIQAALSTRFGERSSMSTPACRAWMNLRALRRTGCIAGILPRDVTPELLRLLCACALSAPSKSDLQQADILIVRDRAKIKSIGGLLPEMPWVCDAPVFLVFFANGGRLPQISRIAWQAVSQRPSRSDVQRNGRCRDRHDDISARGRGGRPRLLPDQRDP